MRAWLLVSTLVALGCVGRPLPSSTPARRNMTTLVARSLSRAKREPTGKLTLVSLGEADVIGIDPTTGERTWRRPIRPFGTPAAYGRLVVIPTHGHRLVALDADSGALAWETRLPGEALTGVSVSERWVVVTALARKEGARSVAAMLSTIDGRLRWQRRSDTLLGVPAAVGRHAFIPQEGDVIAIALPTGRFVSRVRPQQPLQLQSVRKHGPALYAESEDAFVDLLGSLESTYRIQSDRVTAFRRVDGLEPGVGHDDGISLRLLASTTPGTPRRGLFLGRRVVVGLRFDRWGRPIAASWVHLPYDQREYVTMHAEGDRVWLLEASGTLTVLDIANGRTVSRREGDLPPRGAIFVGGRGEPRIADAERGDDNRHADVVGQLIALIEDPDARLLPAQRLAVDLLWHDESPRVRSLVRDVARGVLRIGDDSETETLRQQAAALLEQPWGLAHPESLAALLSTLGAPDGIDDDGWRDATREAVKSGDERILLRLGTLLHDPGISGHALTEISRALRDLDDSRAVGTTCAFVRQYHTDPEIVSESKAIFYALEFLIAQAAPDLPSRVDPEASERAYETLESVLDNEYTVPVVRTFIESYLDAAGEAAAQ